MSYETENFLGAAFGNYFDCIKNSVYSLQKYIDSFHYTTGKFYLDYSSIDNQEMKDLFKFVLMEAEPIIKAKFITFAVEVENFLNKKYESLIQNIRTDENISNRFYISNDAYMFLDNFQNEITSKGKNNPYNKKEEIDKIYQFKDFMEEEFALYENTKFKLNVTTISGKELAHFLDGAFMKVSATMITFKRMIEQSNSMYISASLCRSVISLLIVTYVVISTVTMEE